MKIIKGKIGSAVFAVILVCSLLGTLFPDTIWDEESVQVTDEEGNDITAQYSGSELAELVEEAPQVQYQFRIFEFFQ
ncbi:MAG: hypothetical protein ACI4DU_08640 [Lachnospiraceae bacterium]